MGGGGGACPAHARRATFVLSIPTLTPESPSPEEPPQRSPSSRPEWTANLPYKACRVSRNSRIQHQCVPLMYWLRNSLFPTSVGINTFLTLMLLALTTTCDGGAPPTTQGTHICLILSLILRGSRVAFISPNMREDMVPWSKRRVTDLPPNAKLCEMQQNTHGLVQLVRATTPNVPNHAKRS